MASAYGDAPACREPDAGGHASKDQVAQIIAALSNALALQLSGRPVAIAGYEDHSVAVFGNDQVVTYDDSNVFIDRDGAINANTSPMTTRTS